MALTNLEQAQMIIGMDALPLDAEAQIAELEEGAPVDDKLKFPFIWEGLYTRQMDDDNIEVDPGFKEA